jgi:hypothetical protein
MSAHHVYDNAPLGSLIRYSDDTPKPPARSNKKLAAWQNRNGVARLVKKEPQRDRPTYTSPASITLHEGDFASGGVVLMKILRTHSVDSDLRYGDPYAAYLPPAETPQPLPSRCAGSGRGGSHVNGQAVSTSLRRRVTCEP